MTIIYTLDPRDTAETSPAARAIRPASLDGKTLGLLSNNKPHSEEMLRMVAGIIANATRWLGLWNTTREATSGLPIVPPWRTLPAVAT